MTYDEDDRYQIVGTLARAPAVDEAGIRRLIEGLGDSGKGTEWVNHGAGTEEEWISIRETAERGVARHARSHLAIVRAAMTSDNPMIRAALVRITPVDEPWEELGDWLQDPSPEVRRATLDRLSALAHAIGEGEREAARYRIILRGIVRAFADPDVGIVINAARYVPFGGDEAYKDGKPTPRLLGCRAAARELEQSEPEMFALLRERVLGDHAYVVSSVVAFFGLLHGRADIAELLASVLFDGRAKIAVEWRVAWSLHEVGPVLTNESRARLAATKSTDSAVQLWIDRALAAYPSLGR